MAEAERPESVSILIDGKRVEGWSDLETVDAIDSFSTVGFTAPFEHERKEFRELFRPFSYKPVRVFCGSEPMFTGTLLGVKPRVEADRRTVEVTAIALPGVLEDCMAPASSLPLEFRKLTLNDIASRLLGAFKIAVTSPEGDQPGTPFDKVKIEEDKKIIDFLIELAKQRSKLLSNTAEGQLLCWRAVEPGNPVARLQERQSPVQAVEAEFFPQEYYSEITGYSGAKRGRKGSKYTALNPFLTDVLRPTSFKLDNTEKGDAPDETQARMGRMLANMASYTIEDMPTWRTSDGKLYTSNTTVLVTAPDAMIYSEYELLIRRVRRKQTSDSWTASLDLVLPGSFTGRMPKTLPWD